MANIRVRIKNTKDLEIMLPKLKRSLSVQHNVEIEEEPGGNGVFVMVVKEAIQLKQFVLIKKLLDAYGFEFHLRTVDMDGNDYDPEQEQEKQEQEEEEACQCEVCLAKRATAAAAQEAMRQITEISPDRRVERVRVRPMERQKRAMQEKVAKELLAAVIKMKADLAEMRGE
jgi:hypothetical protein